MYKIFVADLNSLYNEVPNPPVFLHDCGSYDEAVALRNTEQTHDTAAWIEDENGAVVS